MTIASDAVLDGALDIIATCTRVAVCTTEPATYAVTYTGQVGAYTLTAGDGGGDWVIANGDGSGRKITLQAQTGNNGSATGAANFLAFDDGVTLHYTTAGDGDTVNTGSPFTISAYDVCEIADPSQV